MKKKRTTPQQSSPLTSIECANKHNIKTPPKEIVALRRFLRGSMNALDAYRDYGDTALNSTVCNLRRRYQINLDRKAETITNRAGGKSRFMRYSLAANDVERALEIVQRYDRQNGAAA